MTVIAFDGKTLCADRAAESHGLRRSVKKLQRMEDGTLIAICGGAGHSFAIAQWWIAGQKGPFPKNDDHDHPGSIWVITPAGYIINVESSGFAVPFLDKTFAAGSGRDYALGAMAMGADAVQAVKIASELDNSCGNGYDCYTLRGEHE